MKEKLLKANERIGDAAYLLRLIEVAAFQISECTLNDRSSIIKAVGYRSAIEGAARMAQDSLEKALDQTREVWMKNAKEYPRRDGEYDSQ